MCPIRLGEPCSLCEPGVTGPEDCGLVWLVMNDADLRARLAELRREAAGSRCTDGLPGQNRRVLAEAPSATG